MSATDESHGRATLASAPSTAPSAADYMSGHLDGKRWREILTTMTKNSPLVMLGAAFIAGAVFASSRRR